jgi:hypothetical protein
MRSWWPRPPAEQRRPEGSPKRDAVRVPLDEQVRRLWLRPVTSVEEMARDDVVESDEELDAFIAHVYAERHSNLTSPDDRLGGH